MQENYMKMIVFGMIGSAFLFFGFAFFYLLHLDPSDPEIQSDLPQFPWFPDLLVTVFILIGIVFITAMIISFLRCRSSNNIEIELEKTNYKPGEVIEGTIKLVFKKPISGRELKVFFIGEKIITQHTRNGVSSFSAPIHEEEKHLAMNNEFFNQTYPFRFSIPLDILEKAEKTDGTGYGFIGKKTYKLSEKVTSLQKKAMEWAENSRFVQIEKKDIWYIKIHLDIPNKIDVIEKKDIIIS